MLNLFFSIRSDFRCRMLDIDTQLPYNRRFIARLASKQFQVPTTVTVPTVINQIK